MRQKSFFVNYRPLNFKKQQKRGNNKEKLGTPKGVPSFLASYDDLEVIII